MATLRIEATPSADLLGYRFQLDEDQTDLNMGTENRCTIDDFDGQCGDGSTHHLFYTLVGPIGAKVDLKIWCDDTLKIDFPVEIFAAGPAFNGDVEFRL